MIRYFSAITVVMVLFAASSVHAADPLPTPDELKQLYTAGNYKDLIPKLNKVLTLKGAEAAKYDRYTLLTLKGETSLRTHSKSTAADAFKLAVAASTQPTDAAVALATADLITHSNGALKYLPRTRASKDDKPEPIDIVDADSRKLALEAFKTDLAARLKIKVDAAVAGSSLPQLQQVASCKEMSEFKSVELAATSGDSDTDEMLVSLGDRAMTLVNDALEKMTTDLDADVTAVNARNGPNPGAKPGSNTNTAISINQFEQAMTTIDSNAKQLRDYANSVKGVFGQQIDLKPMAEKANQIITEAEKLLGQAKKAGG